MTSRSIRRRRATSCLFAACVVLAPAAAMAQWPERLSKLPEAPNVVAVFYVVQLRLLKKKFEGTAGAPAARLIDEVGADIAPDVHYLAICAQLDLQTLEPQWELSIAHASKLPTADELAQQEGGHVDEIGGKKAVWSPRQAYLIPLDPKRLAVVRPASRQRLVRWEQLVREEKHEGLTPYLQEAVSARTDDYPIILAVEMDGVVSPFQAREKLSNLDAVGGENANLDELAKLFGGLKGIVFSVGRGRDSLEGSLRIDFGASAAPLEKIGKSLVLEVLSDAGMFMDDVNHWSAKAQGNSLTLSGSVSSVNLRQMLGFLTTPAIVSSVQQTASFSTTPEGTRVPLEEVTRKATKYYFDSTSATIHQCRNSKARNAGEQVTWNERAARKIDDLPMLNVDPDMLDYGRQVSELLRGASLTIRSVNMQAGVERAGAPSTVFRPTNAWYGPYGGGYVRGVNAANPQLAVIRAEQNRQGNSTQQENMAQIDQLTLDLRRRMTERYRIEF